MSDANERVGYDLPLTGAREAAGKSAVHTDASLGIILLKRNVAWFTQLRWIVVAVFLVLALLDLSGALRRLGMQLDARCLLSMAAILTLLNLAFIWHRARIGDNPRVVHLNLWAQIASDLVMLSVVVHQVGSYTTFAPFLYLVHITLACIFFSRRHSFAVVLLASTLYAGDVILEHIGVLEQRFVFTSVAGWTLPALPKSVHVGSAILLWLVMWSLVAELSTKLRQRQREVLEAQQRTLRTFQDAQAHMRHTSHQMKAPLDAIRGNVSLMRQGYAGELTDKARDLLGKIDARCNALGDFVADVLHLARLKAGEELSGVRESVPLHALIDECVEALRAKADHRRIEIHVTTEPLAVHGDREAIGMLLDNLLTNAINYSFDGGIVTVDCRRRDGAIVLSVADRGIGIPADKLPRIFDEYYRTNEAKQHNRHSTGVGLTIVREVAASHHIRVRVDSAVGQGTTFTLTFADA